MNESAGLYAQMSNVRCLSGIGLGQMVTGRRKVGCRPIEKSLFRNCYGMNSSGSLEQPQLPLAGNGGKNAPNQLREVCV
jgi:hypothetical protein